MTIVFKVVTQSFPDLHFPWLGEASLSLSTEMPGPAPQQILLCCTIKIKLQREVKLWLTPLIAEPLKTIYFSLQKPGKVPNKQRGKFQGNEDGVILHAKHEEHSQESAQGKPASKLKCRVR